MSIPRIDFYTHTHKKLRKWLFAVSVQAGAADYADDKAIAELGTEFGKLLTELREHAMHEATFIHPLIAAKIPGGADILDEEHFEQEKLLDDLEDHCQRLQKTASDHEKRATSGLEFYRAFNRFIAIYLEHIDAEEYLMPILWEYCTATELTAMMVAFQTFDAPSKGLNWLKDIMPKAALAERIELLHTIKTHAPAEITKTIYELIPQTIAADEWQLLTKHVK